MKDDQKFHWGEGMKYAVEGIKNLFLLNGGAILSILTFIGNTKSHSHLLVASMFAFAIDAASSIILFLFAYLTQLEYGNDNYLDNKWHGASYGTAMLSILMFFLGLALSGVGLIEG